MSNVDKRIVQMEFDNKQFEKDMQATVKSLHNFEKDLNNVGTSGKAFEGISKSLDNVKANIKGFSLDAVSNAFEKVKVTISGWEMAAMAAITRVVDGAMNAAQNMARSLIVAPVSQGFEEYELKMNSIQTMMMGSGASLDTVSKKLNELNAYADRTIYSFSDMTQNIGKFINAGVSLDDSVAAIQGVANVAAISGANANEASRAMYNFAQALSSGSIRLIDWKSIENANMATVEFKQQLIDTAVKMGTLVKLEHNYISTTADMRGKVSDAFNATTKFNDSLGAQWLTSQVLTETLKKYTDETTELGKKAYAAAQDVKTFSQLMDTLKEAVGSGWAQTWELIFGNFDEAKKLWTEISNAVGGFINKQADARNNILKLWAEAGGRAALFEDLKNIFNDLIQVIKPIGEAFTEIFGKFSAAKLLAFNRELYSLSFILQPTKEEILEIKDVFKSLFQFVKSTTEPLFRAWKEAFPAGTLMSFVRNFTSLIGNVIKSITDAFNALTDNGEVIHNVAFTVFSVLRTGINVLTFLFSIIKSIIKITAPIATFLGKIIGYIVNIVTEIGSLIFKSSAIRDSIVKITNSINKLVNPLKEGLLYAFALLQPHLDRFKEWALTGAKWLGDNIAKGIQFLADKIEKLVGKIKDFTASFNFSKEGIEATKNKLDEYKNKVTDVSNAVVDSIKKNETISNIWNGIKSFLSNAWNGIKNFFSNVWNGSQDLFPKIQEYVQKALDFLKERFSNAYEEIRKNGLFASTGKGIGSVIGNIGKGLSIMVQNLIPFKDKILEFFGADSVVELIKDFVKVFIGIKAGKSLDIFKSMSKGLESLTNAVDGITTSIKNAIDSVAKRDISKSFKNFAIGIGIIAAALFVVSKIDSNALWPSVLALSALIGVIAFIFARLDEATKDSTKVSSRFAAMALLLAAFGSSISKILLAIGALIAIINAVNNIGAVATAIGIVGLIIVLIGAFVILFAKFSENRMDPKSILATALMIKAIGSAIKGIAIVIGILSLFNPGKLLIAGAIIEALTITILGGLILMMSKGSSYGLKPTQILAFSLMIKTLGSAIKGIGLIIAILSLFDSTKVLIAATVIGVISILFGGIIAALSALPNPKKLMTASKSMLILSAAIGIISVVISTIAKGNLKNTLSAVIILIGSLTILSGILIALSAFAVPIQAMSTALLTFGIAALAFGAGIYLIVESVKTLTDLGPSAINLMTEAITAIVANIPKWTGMLITGLFEYLGKLIPSIVQSLIKVVISIIEGITSGIGSIISAIVKLFKTIVEALSTYSNAFDIKDLFWAIQSIALIAGLIFILQIISSDMGAAVKGIALMATVLGLLVASLLVINSYTNPTKSIGILQGIASVFLTFAALFAIIGGITLAFDKIPGGSNSVPLAGIFKAVVAFGLVILVMVAVVAIISALVALLENAFEGLDILAMINRGSQIMSAVGEAIGDFFAGIIEPLSKTMTNNGVNVGTILALVPLILALEPLLLVLPILTLFVGAIGALATLIEDNTDWDVLAVIQKGAEIMGGIGEALGQFVGGFVNGVMKQFSKGLMDSLIIFADGLGTFMDHMNPFLDALNKINGDLLEKTGQLTLIILAMCAAELISGITGFLTWMTGGNSLTKFAKELEAMGPYLVKFSNKLKKGHFDGATVNSAANAALLMSKVVNNLPRDGGLWQNIIGHSQSLKDFGKTFDELGKGLVTFAQHTHKISKGNTEKMKTAAEIVKTLASIANEMPRHGGWLQNLLGETTDVDDFGNQLQAFGSGLADFAMATNGISKGNVTRATNAITVAEKIVSLANSLPNATGGVWGKIFGEQMNIETFGGQLSAFGNGVAWFAQNTKGITETHITSSGRAIDIATKISELSNTLGEDKEGGVIGFFAGTSKESLESFSEKLPKLGTALATFAEKTKDIGEVKDVSDTVTAVQNLVTAFKSAKDIGNFNKNFLVHLHDLVYGEGSDYTGDELEKVGGLLGDKPWDVLWNLNYVTDAIIKLATTFKNVPTDIPSLNTSLLKNLHALTTESAFTGYTGDEFKKAGDLLGDKPQDVLWNLHYVTDAITELATAFKSAKDIGNLNENFLVHLHDLVYGEGSDYTGDELEKVGSIMGDKPWDVLWNLNYIKDAIIKLSETFSNESIKNIGNFNKNFLVHLHDLVYGEGSDYTGDELLKASTLLGDNPQDVLCNLHYVADAITELVACLSGVTGLDSGSLSTFFDSVSKISKLSVDTIKADFVDRASEVVEAANDLIFDVGMAFLNKQTPLENNVKSLLLAIPSAFSNNMGEIKESALSYISGETGVIYAIGKAFIDGQEPLKGNVKDFILSALDAISPFNSVDPYMPGTFYIAGSNSAWGYIKGINDSLNDVLNAGKSIGEKSLEGANKAVDNRSPSHKFEDYVAYNSVLGFVRGFRKRAHLALEAGEYLGQNALNGTQGIASKFDNILNSDMNLQPVITPVLDLSQMSIQSERIGGMLNANNSVIAAGRVYSLIEQGRMLRLDARINQNGSPDVVAAVENLINRMDSMEEAIINRPIELDGDRVTKKLTPRVDKALGQRAYYSRRGN